LGARVSTHHLWQLERATHRAVKNNDAGYTKSWLREIES
jgi:hypothetical protein